MFSVRKSTVQKDEIEIQNFISYSNMQSIFKMKKILNFECHFLQYSGQPIEDSQRIHFLLE